MSILFGGFSCCGVYYDDTWIWDGTTNTWVQLFPALSPPARCSAGMSYDAKNNNVILYGGIRCGTQKVLGDTWKWNGTIWANLNPVPNPGLLYGISMAYDYNNQNIVLFGGYDLTTYSSSTWIWNGTSWTQQMVVGPSARAYASMAYDGTQIILFGGINGSTFYNDTWAWNGTSWTLLTTPVLLTNRAYSSMTYDIFNNYAILYGGTDAVTLFTDTWIHSGGTWTQLTPGTTPATSAYASMAYDYVAFNSVLFGGTIPPAGDALTNNTYEWNGVNWSGPSSNPLLKGRALASFASNPNVITCVANDSLILLSDGSYKKIQNIERGDMVAADPSLQNSYKVARLISKSVDDISSIDITIFQPGSIAENIPNNKLIITSSHRIIWQDTIKRAKLFADYPNVSRYRRCKIIKNNRTSRKKSSLSEHNITYLYDIQFETPGTYVVEGLVVESRSNLSYITPLPRELYFDQSLYDKHYNLIQS